jgi:phosphoribosylformylglycinamidine cyclo-ligase
LQGVLTLTEFFPDAFSDMVRVRKHGVLPLERDTGDILNQSRLQKGIFQKDLSDYHEPVIVSVTSSIGSKLKLAAITGMYDTIGIDTVAMCANSIASMGASPMYFMHHLTLSDDHDNAQKAVKDVYAGIQAGCERAGFPSIGLNVYESSDQVSKNGVLLAGYCSGLAENDALSDTPVIEDGDMLIGLASTGVHYSGFQFIISKMDLSYQSLSKYIPEFSKTLGEELLVPARIYSRAIVQLQSCGHFHIKRVAHVSTGGLEQSILSILPDDLRATVFPGHFPIPEIFHLISTSCDIPQAEMFNTFNMGIGLVLVIPKNEIGSVFNALIQCGEHPYAIGCCSSGEKGVDFKW